MRNMTLKDGREYSFEKMKIMGIVNVNDDSFYEGSRASSTETAVKKALSMITDGADIIDIGGESTRPGSEPINVEEEINRVIPVIKGIRKINSSILISVDTYRAKTAEESIKAGADIINDISAMTFDESMAEVICKYNCPIILMHIMGTPNKIMQDNPNYGNVISEVKSFLEQRVQFALSKGIVKDKIILDPGIGFSKLYEHDIELIKKIDELRFMDLPILLAVSRKRCIGKATGNLLPNERLEGTIAVTCYAALKGIDMVRVHDVKENKRAAMMMEALNE